MDNLRFGIIGCGLMGREFAAAAMRWLCLEENIPEPIILGVANRSDKPMEWFKKVPTVKYFENDYRQLLANPQIDAVYIAVPHNFHEQIYIDAIKAGKHIMGEKPFGMDQAANSAILKELGKHPGLFCRCASQMAFYPGAQKVVNYFQSGKCGKLLAVKAGFNHASDLNAQKLINWKRQAAINGKYGVLRDLGMHTQFIPIRLGFQFNSVYSVLSDFITERNNGNGEKVICDTFDNAHLSCKASYKGGEFPIYLETDRMHPGATNQWYIEIYGLNGSAKFSTEDSNAFYFTKHDEEYANSEPVWNRLDVGNTPQFRTNTGKIFEFGFSDAVLQMWAAFMAEYSGMQVEFGCMRPEETAVSHAVMTAAIKSNESGSQEIPNVL